MNTCEHMNKYVLPSVTVVTALVGGFFGMFFGTEFYGKFLKNPDLPNELKPEKTDKDKYVLIDAAKSYIPEIPSGFFDGLPFFGKKDHEKVQKKPDKPNNSKVTKADEYKHAIINTAKLYISKTLGGLFGIVIGVFVGWKSPQILTYLSSFSLENVTK